MTDHYNGVERCTGRHGAEALRQRLHARMSSVSLAATEGQPHLDTARFDLDERPAPMKEFTVSDNSTNNNHRDGRRLAMAAAAVVAVIAVTAIALAINDASDDDQAPTPAATIAPTTTVTLPTTEPTALDDHGSLSGRWTTGAIPIEEIRATMLQAGVTAELVDEWVREVGSPSEYTFSLEFNGDEFSHSAMTPQQTRQVDESGTFVFDTVRSRLHLSVADQGNTYVFTALRTCCDDLHLRFVDPTESGTAADPAEHARTIALYTSAPFHRRP